MKINKRDIILIIIVAAAAAVIYLCTQLFAGDAGSTIEITVDGEVYGTYLLDEDQTITVSDEYGTNVIVIEDGSAHMEEADCPDGYCMDQGSVSRSNQTIVCLPHKLVVSVVSEGDTDDMDAVTK